MCGKSDLSAPSFAAVLLLMRFPAFPLPLRGEDAEPIVDLQALLNAVYDRAAYDFRIDYTAEPIPSLSETDAAWADALLRETGLRS